MMAFQTMRIAVCFYFTVMSNPALSPLLCIGLVHEHFPPFYTTILTTMYVKPCLVTPVVRRPTATAQVLSSLGALGYKPQVRAKIDRERLCAGSKNALL